MIEVERSAADMLREGLRAAETHADDGRFDKVLLDLREHRDFALKSGELGALLEALPLAIRVAEWDRQTRQAAEDYIQTTSNALASTYLGPDYERKSTELLIELIEKRRARLRERLITVATVSGVVALLGLGAVVVSYTSYEFLRIPGLVALAVGAFYGAVAYALRLTRDSELAAEIERLERRGRIAAAVPTAMGLAPSADEAAGGQYFTNLVRINVTNLGDYYVLVKVHTNNSFRASLAAGGLGFLLIAVGLGIGFFSDQDQSIAFLATASGVLVEFISGVFFYLYNRTVRQLKEYHDSLLHVQNILLSFKIVEDSDVEHRGALLEKILTFLLHRDADLGLKPSE